MRNRKCFEINVLCLYQLTLWFVNILIKFMVWFNKVQQCLHRQSVNTRVPTWNCRLTNTVKQMQTTVFGAVTYTTSSIAAPVQITARTSHALVVWTSTPATRCTLLSSGIIPIQCNVTSADLSGGIGDRLVQSRRAAPPGLLQHSYTTLKDHGYHFHVPDILPI